MENTSFPGLHPFLDATESAVSGGSGGISSGTPPLVSVNIQTALYALTAILTVVCNTLTLVALHQVPNCFDEVTQFILKALVVTDLLTGMSCTTLTAAVSILRHLKLMELCAIRQCFCSCSVNISSLFVAFACLDRFLAITQPLRYHMIFSVSRARIGALVITVFGVLVGGISVFPSARTTLCISNFSSDSNLPFRPTLIISLIVLFVCLVVALYTNSRVVSVALKRSNRVRDEALPNRNVVGRDALPLPRANLRGLAAVVMATSGYFVAVVPWAIVSAAQFNPSTTLASPDIRFFTSLLLLSNSFWNALIYIFLSKKFRTAVRKTFGIEHADDRENITMSSGSGR